MSKPRILLTGHDGLLGSHLAPELAEIGDLVCLERDDFDLSRPETIHQMVQQIHPGLVVHLAAETRVDYCQQHPEEAFALNARSTAQLAQACRRVGSRVLLLSTDYVFDGRQRSPYREYQAPGAVNFYGASKEEAERAVLALCHNSLIVRSSSLYGVGGHNFVDAILQKARAGESLKVVADQTQSPTWAAQLAAPLAKVAWSDLCGIIHLSGSGSCTWHEFALAILEEAKLSVGCDPIDSAGSGRPAPRPAYSVLDCRLAAALADVRLPDWRDGLAAYLSGAKA